uniref:Protein-serine/threonine phosphatase n=1 Tax=Loa loa TaxID=7209 RepID=A0A1I7VPZ2_LOALO
MRKDPLASSTPERSIFDMRQLNHFVFPPSLKCRLSIIKREVRQSLANESERIDDGLIDRCVEVGVGAVGTSSPVQLIGVAYNLYKQQLASSDLEKERAGRKHFALKFLDETVAEADRIFCYIMYKLPDGTVSASLFQEDKFAKHLRLQLAIRPIYHSILEATLENPTPTKKIREVVNETKCADLEEWKEKAYSTFAAIPAVKVDVKIVLQDLYIASLRSLTHNDFHMLKEKDIDCLVVYSEFLDFGFNLKGLLPLFDEETMIIIENPSILSISMDVFARIHKWRCKESRVCVACDTDGLTISGLVVARYLSLSTRCSHEDAIKAVKISHESFFPLPYAQGDFLNAEFEEEEADQFELQAPSSDSKKNFDRCMLQNCIRVYGNSL